MGLLSAPLLWLGAGAALLVLELALPGAYLVFFGAGAMVVGLNLLLLGEPDWFGWGEQAIAFVAVAAAALLVGRDWYRRALSTRSKEPLNHRTDRLVGQTAIVSEPIVSGRGRIAVEDGWWNAEGPDLPTGTHVRIVGAKGSTLEVVPEPHRL